MHRYVDIIDRGNTSRPNNSSNNSVGNNNNTTTTTTTTTTTNNRSNNNNSEVIDLDSNNNNNSSSNVRNRQSLNSNFTGDTLDSLTRLGVSSYNSNVVETNVIKQMDKEILAGELKQLDSKLKTIKDEIQKLNDYIEDNSDPQKSSAFSGMPNANQDDVVKSFAVLLQAKKKRLNELIKEERIIMNKKKQLVEENKKRNEYKPAKELNMNEPSSFDKAMFGGVNIKETAKEKLVRLGKITPFANVNKKTIVIPIMTEPEKKKETPSIRLGSSGRFSNKMPKNTDSKKSIERYERRKKWMKNANKARSTKSTTFYNDLKMDDLDFSDSDMEELDNDKQTKRTRRTRTSTIPSKKQTKPKKTKDSDEEEDEEDSFIDDNEVDDDEEDEDDNSVNSISEEDSGSDQDYKDEDEEMVDEEESEVVVDDEEESEEENKKKRKRKGKGKEKEIDLHSELWKDDSNESLYQARLLQWKKDRFKAQKQIERKQRSNNQINNNQNNNNNNENNEDIDTEDENTYGHLLEEEKLLKRDHENSTVGLNQEETELVNEMDKQLDNQVDDIKEDFKLDEDFTIPSEIYHKLFEYQVTGVKWMWELHCQESGGIIGDEMGLGKTIQVISFLASLHYSGLLGGPSIIVAPATLLSNWVKEIHTWWPPFRVVLYHSSGTTNKADQVKQMEKVAERGHIILTTYESIRMNQDLLLKYHWEYVILDEGHKIRNPDADITLAVKQFPTCHRIILSGSPIQNKLTELWSLFDFVFPGKLGTMPIFLTQFAVPISLGGYSNASQLQVQTAYKCAVALRDIISPYMIRRVKQDVLDSLPSKNEQVLLCPLTPHQEELYLKFLSSHEARDVLDGKRNLLYAIDILKKICNHPDILHKDIDDEERPVDYGNIERSSKLKVVQQILPMWRRQGHKVLFFCQTRQMLDIVEDWVSSEYKDVYRRMDGTTSVKTRQLLVEEFNTDQSLFIFLLTTKVGGLGINLTGASRVILFDPDWNPSTDVQARERVYRIGQTKNVTIYRLMTTGTIEEKIYHRQIYKQFLSNKILKDPRQKRFFQSRHFKDLLSYAKIKKGSETGGIFSGTGSEILPEDFKKKKQKKSHHQDINNNNNSNSVEDIDNIDNDEDDEKGDAKILKHLFDNQGLKSALKHDSIMDQSGPEHSLLEEEATRIATKAVEVLKKSRARIESDSNRYQTPTWTGRSGYGGDPMNDNNNSQPQQPPKPNRFGNKNKNSLLSNVNSSQSIVSSSPTVTSPRNVSQSNTISNENRTNNQNNVLGGSGRFSSSDILSTFNEIDNDTVSEMFGGIKPSEIIESIFNFITSKGGSCSTSDIIGKFTLTIKPDQAPLFRSLLKSVATFNKPTKLWELNRL